MLYYNQRLLLPKTNTAHMSSTHMSSTHMCLLMKSIKFYIISYAERIHDPKRAKNYFVTQVVERQFSILNLNCVQFQ